MREGLGVRLLLAVLFVGLVVGIAWTCDDALISFRVVDNARAGLGLVWNTDERVQVFSNPAWVGCLIAARGLFGSAWATSIALSIAATAIATAVLGLGVASRGRTAVWVLSALVGSKAAVEYGTSGLENPLTHLLLALWVWAVLRERPRLAAWLAGAVLLDRLDALALVVPWVAATAWSRRIDRAAFLARVGAPVLLWLGFATVYYGSPWPNPVIAKVFVDVDRWAIARHGLDYVVTTAVLDPGTALALALAWAIAWRGRDLPHVAVLAVGSVLALLAVVSVGGDFMVGRFFTAPLWLALLAAAPAYDARPLPGWLHRVAVVTSLACAVLPASAPLRQGPASRHADGQGTPMVADERSYWSEQTSLIGGGAPPSVSMSRDPATPSVLQANVAGATGASAGPGVHVYDVLGITDPFVARLPVRFDDWRPGHFRRPVPVGYEETLAAASPRFADPEMSACWTRVALATRGPLLAPGRAEAIGRLLWSSCNNLWGGRMLQGDGRLR